MHLYTLGINAQDNISRWWKQQSNLDQVRWFHYISYQFSCLVTNWFCYDFLRRITSLLNHHNRELLELAYKVLFGQYNVKVKCFYATILRTVLNHGVSCPKEK